MPRINAGYREDAKKKIIAAALDVAASEGWGALTLDAIARRMGVTKGAFYAYFKNSGSLLQDVIIEMIRIIRDRLVEGTRTAPDIHAALDQVSGFIFMEPKPFMPVFIQAIAGMPDDPAFREKIAKLFEENSSHLVDAIARFQESGQIPRETDLPSAVKAIYAMTIGLGLMTHILERNPAESRRIWIESAERILGIGPAPAKNR